MLVVQQADFEKIKSEYDVTIYLLLQKTALPIAIICMISYSVYWHYMVFFQNHHHLF